MLKPCPPRTLHILEQVFLPKALHSGEQDAANVRCWQWHMVEQCWHHGDQVIYWIYMMYIDVLAMVDQYLSIPCSTDEHPLTSYIIYIYVYISYFDLHHMIV